MKKINLLQLLFLTVMMSVAVSCDNINHKCDCDDWQSQVPEGTFCYANQGRPSNMLKYKEIISMLESYDETRNEVLEKSLGFEDTRVNSYPIQQLKDYLGYIESLCAEKEIPLTGINIISAAYPENYSGSKSAGYQTLIFMPTTTIDGEEFVTFDPLKSKKGAPTTFKSILAKRGYHWSYDKSRVSKEAQKAGIMNFNSMQDDLEDSSGANRLKPTPPY